MIRLIRFCIYLEGGVFFLFFNILLSFLFCVLLVVDEVLEILFFWLLGLFGYFNWIIYFKVLMVILIGFDFNFV